MQILYLKTPDTRGICLLPPNTSPRYECPHCTSSASQPSAPGSLAGFLGHRSTLSSWHSAVSNLVNVAEGWRVMFPRGRSFNFHFSRRAFLTFSSDLDFTRKRWIMRREPAVSSSAPEELLPVSGHSQRQSQRRCHPPYALVSRGPPSLPCCFFPLRLRDAQKPVLQKTHHTAAPANTQALSCSPQYWTEEDFYICLHLL